MNKKVFLILILISCLIFSQVSFAEAHNDNLTSVDDSQDVIKNDNTHNKTVFIISDNPGTNIIDSACDEIYNQDNKSGFNIVLRSGEQVKDMSENELHSLFSTSDAFIGEWISTDVDSVLTNLLQYLHPY